MFGDVFVCVFLSDLVCEINCVVVNDGVVYVWVGFDVLDCYGLFLSFIGENEICFFRVNVY